MSGEDLPGLIARVADRLHLGEYEREAYLTVLEHGSLAASELADRTSIPQPRVYDTVRSLEERGLVEVHESRPMQVVAIDPTDAFAGITASMEELVSRLQATYTAPDPDQPAVSLLKSGSTIIRNIGNIIEAAEYELALALSPQLLTRFESELQTAKSNGVSIELIVSPIKQAPNSEEFEYDAVATAIRGRRGYTTPIIAVADGERSIFATQEAFERDQDRYGVLFSRSALGFLLFGFYGTVLWTTAEPLTAISEQPDFPRRYASVRRCIKEIGGMDGTFFASVSGRWVDSDRPCDIVGRVADATMEETAQVASIEIEVDGECYTVGGRLAAYEDIEAHMLRVGREPLS